MQEDTPSPARTTPRNEWFALEHFKALHRQADACRRELGLIEKLCVGGVVAAFIWLARDADLYSGTAALAWFLPILVAFYGALKSQGVEARLASVDDAIERMQASMASAGDGLHALARPRARRARWLLARAAWVLFVGLTAGAAMVGFEGIEVLGDEEDGITEQTTTAEVAWPQRSADPARAL